MTIEEEWSEDTTQIRTGEPVTRTLTIRAAGQTAEQLDDIEIADIDGVKQYPDKAVLENQHERDGITGIRQVKVAMIPTQQGRYAVPEIRIPWWNTRTGKQEIATLPETVIEATGMAGPARAAPATEMVAPQAAAGRPSGESAAHPTGAAETTTISPGYWPWISLALAVGWIATSILLFNQTRLGRPRAAKPERKLSMLPLERDVEKACSRADADGTKRALLAWAAVRWPQHTMTSLADIAGVTPAELSTRIDALNRALYSADGGEWDPRALLAAFQAFIAEKRGRAKPRDPVLEPLYKT